MVTLKHYKAKGKRTIYSPGLVTAYCALLEVGVYSVYWLVTSQSFVMEDLWGIAFVVFLIGFMIRLPFIISFKIKSTKYAYTEIGYFRKYEK